MMDKCNGKEGSHGTQHHLDSCEEIFPKGRITDSVNCTGTRSQLSTLSTMSRNFSPVFVYQRRRQHNENSIPIIANGIKPINISQSAISLEVLPIEPHIITKVSTDTVDRILNVSDANENCSSSKSDLELSSASRKLNTDEAAECSSSDALINQSVISAKDLCISFLKSQGLLCNTFQGRERRSGVRTENLYSKKACGVCRRVGSTLHMLVCDNCENGFHVSCYVPVITVLPVGEWLCGCCFKKKKDEILKDKLSRANDDLNYVGNEAGRDQCLGSEGELGSLEFMFRDTEPYMSNARIGDEYQAKVPDFSGPIYEECGVVGFPLDTSPCDNINMQGGDSIKPSQLSSIGNWLQCRGVIEGVGDGTDGNICAKWRRAPLFEVQTDKWECFCCIHWDPAHADCAAPQELDTEEVMKQLKYIEMLKPQLSTKRRKVDPRSKCNSSQEHP